MPTAFSKFLEEAGRDIMAQVGPGHAECVYQRCLAKRLREYGATIELEKTCPVLFDSIQVGVIRPDIVVNRTVAVEVKAVASVCLKNRVQLKKYADTHRAAFLVNFPQRLDAVAVQVIRLEE